MHRTATTLFVIIVTAATYFTNQATAAKPQEAPWNAKVEWTDCPTAQVSAPVHVQARWKPGDQLFVEIRQHMRKSSKGTLQETNSLSYAVLKVLQSQANGLLLEWTYQGELFDANTLQPLKYSQELNALLAAAGNIRIRYRTSLTGSYVELLNPEEVRQQFEDTNKKLLDQRSRTGTDPNTLKATSSLL